MGENHPKSSAAPVRRRIRLNTKKQHNEDEFMAAAIGDTEWLRQSIRESRGEIHYDKNGLAPIHLASIHGRLDCIKLLIEKFKVDVNLPSTTGWRPIHLCISNQTGKRSFACLVYLLEHDADPNITNDDGVTPVHQAASEGHVQCLKLLIEIGATIDGMDCRGHTPIVLAKLWGHRKSARILAAEQWSRDKDHVATEMNQLKKVKMLQVLQEMEEEDVHKAEQKFYGDAAFKNWLGEKGLKTTPAKPKLTQKEKQDQAKKAAAKALAQKEQSRTKSQKSDIREEAEWRQQSREHTRESLFKANSRTQTSRHMDTFPIAEVEQNGNISPKKVQIITKEDVTGSPLPPTRESTKRLKTASTDTSWGYNLHESQAPGYETRESTQHTDTENKESFYNPLAWNKSTKTPVPEHVSRLRDAYPRDFYTMMPHKDAAPKELNIRQGPVVELDEKSGLKSVRMPDLPRDVIMKALAKDPLKYERPVLYRCKNIIDAQTKTKYTPDNSPSRSEAGIHLSDDLRSHLVQSGLERAVAADLMRTLSAGRSGLSSTTDSEVERMVQTMKRMARPSHFPNTGGEEYDINFGNLTCI